jgi:hypothetical protein
VFLSSLIDRFLGKRNIELPKWQPKPWDAAHVESSLQEMLTYAEQNAKAAMDWYWDKKRWKAITSRACRLGAILCTAAAALIPVIGSSGWNPPPTGIEPTMWTLKMNQAGYFSLGLAALFLALDRFLSGSSSWMRYVATATSIQTTLEQFRLDWDRRMAALDGRAPVGDDLMKLIDRISEFTIAVRTMVEDETKAWAAEFQANLAELQKGTSAAIEQAREQVQSAEKQSAAQQEAAKAGGINLKVEGLEAVTEGYDVLVGGRTVKTGLTSPTCGIPSLAPGLQDITVRARIGTQPLHASQLVTITAGAITQVELTLATSKAATSGN